ncbi:class I SAM-dependent methyltransferase [Candidatus Woesearchaeota archaeon]|nr:MAG: class I SAM-dependent methyltransferase [Candidatus Woesearchaeota archaeon]
MPVSDPKVVELYNAYAQQYFEYSYEKILQYQLTQFLSFLPGRKILDAGCGSGRDVEYLRELGYDAVGIDASEELIKAARENVDAEFHVMPLEEMSFDDESFDGIWCLAALFYLSRENARNVVLKMHSLLRKDGVLYLGLLEGTGTSVIREKALNLEPVEVQLYTQQEIENLLEESGFDIITAYIEEGEDGEPWLNVFARKR